MTDQEMNEIVADAVGKSFDEWAAEHPSLAAVIDRIRLTEQTVESLRNTEAYRQAVAAYHHDQSDLDFLAQLVDLAGPVLRGILGV